MSEQPKAPGRRAAIVTGASSGIGKGISMVLAREGYDISTAYKSNEEGIEELEKTVAGTYGRRFHAVQGDLSDPAFAERYGKEAIRELGEVHLLVNNAGAGFRDKLVDIKTEDMLSFINIDFVAPIILMREVARHMLDKGIGGSLINITSTRAERAYPHDSLYGGMKAGLRRAAESIAIELAMHGIRVNNVAPGATEIERGDDDYYKELGETLIGGILLAIGALMLLGKLLHLLFPVLVVGLVVWGVYMLVRKNNRRSF